MDLRLPWSSLTTLPKVLDGGGVDREEPNSGTIFWAHVRDGGTVSQGKLLHPWTIELHKLPNHTYLTQMLKICNVWLWCTETMSLITWVKNTQSYESNVITLYKQTLTSMQVWAPWWWWGQDLLRWREVTGYQWCSSPPPWAAPWTLPVPASQPQPQYLMIAIPQ